MNGVIPGPLWLAVASATSADPIEYGVPTNLSKSDTVAGERPPTKTKPSQAWRRTAKKRPGGSDLKTGDR
jgi:hypothetical protein